MGVVEKLLISAGTTVAVLAALAVPLALVAVGWYLLDLTRDRREARDERVDVDTVRFWNNRERFRDYFR